MGSLTLTELFKGRYSFVAPRKYGGFFRKESEHRDFISIGTAAGRPWRPLPRMTLSREQTSQCLVTDAHENSMEVSSSYAEAAEKHSSACQKLFYTVLVSTCRF